MECFTIRLNVVQLQGELKHAHVHTVIQQQIKDLICCSTVQLTNFILSFSTAAQEALNNLEDYDKTCLESALQGVSNIVQQEWGCTCPCQVVCFLLSTWRDEHHSSYNIPSIGVWWWKWRALSNTSIQNLPLVFSTFKSGNWQSLSTWFPSFSSSSNHSLSSCALWMRTVSWRDHSHQNRNVSCSVRLILYWLAVTLPFKMPPIAFVTRLYINCNRWQIICWWQPHHF